MSKGLKIGLGLLALIIIGFGTVFYIISKKVNPEEIKKIVVSSISKGLPGANVALEKVDYSLGTTIKVYVKGLKLNLKKDGSNLFNVQNIEAKVPILAILTGGGSVDLDINEPNMLYKDISVGVNNWSLALPKSEPEKQVKEVKPETAKNLELPSFVDNSKINVKISNLNVTYAPYKKNESNIRVNKISFKNINLKSSTAYEVLSSINYSINKDQTFSTYLKVVGEVNVGKFLKEKVLESSIILDVSDSKLTGLNIKIPNIENKIKLKIDKSGFIESNLKLKASNIINLSTLIKLNKNKLKVSDILLDVSLGEIPSILSNEYLNLIKGVGLSGVKFKTTGFSNINLDKLAMSPNLNFELTGPLNLSFIKDVPIKSSLKGSVLGKKVNLKVINELLGGTITANVKTDFDPLNIPTQISKFSPIDVGILATNIKLNKKFIQKTLYTETTSSKVKKVEVSKKLEPAVKVIFPKVNLGIDAKNIFIDKQEMNLSSKISVINNSISSKDLMLNFGKGVVTSPFNVTIKDSQNILSKLSMKMKNIDFSSFSAFLPPLVSNISGNFNGDVKGDVSLLPKGLKYDLNIDVTATNGEIKDFKLKELVTGMFKSLKDKFPKQAELVTNRFKKLKVSLKANENLNNISNFNFIGDKDSFDLQLKGKLYMIDKESVLIGKLKDAKTTNELKKKTGYDYYPIKFSGKGLVLINPHPEYTMQILVGGLAKKEAQKAIKKESKKLEKKVKKEFNKFLKGIKF